MKKTTPVGNAFIREAKRLYSEGWGVHWIKPMSKAPVESRWANGERQPWEKLEKSYREGYGLGVRLGKPSNTKNGYLANIDVDIKSGDKKHREEALAEIERRFPGATKSLCVKTGYGLRFFILTPRPLPSKKLTASPETCKVYMPTSVSSKQQEVFVKEGRLTAEELKSGWRIRPAWEIELMSDKRQALIPPTIHPDTKRPYRWVPELDLARIKRIDAFSGDLAGLEGNTKGSGVPEGKNLKRGHFEFTDVNLDDPRFTAACRGWLEGDGVIDRSAACLSVAMSMVSSGFSDKEILSVLTDKSLMLGETAFDHRKTKSRAIAADWVNSYVLRKAKDETSAARDFENAVDVEVLDLVESKLSDNEKEHQSKAVLSESWQLKLKRSGKDGDGPPRPTMENTSLVLMNAIGVSAFRLDLGSGLIRIGARLPYEDITELGRGIKDSDVSCLVGWFGRRFGFEPSHNVLWDAITEMAEKAAYNPVKIELESLPPWDGKERLNGWLKRYFEAEGPDEYLAQIFRKWLVASITRTYEPGYKFDWMPLLEGVQGGGKSSFGAILFGQNYFVDYLPNLHDKDAALTLRGMRCIEFSELSSLHRAEVQTAKAFITRQVDKIRPPYGRAMLEVPRTCVFFGTTNDSEFLTDKTGNRRFIPVKVGALNFRALERDKDLLWAEAFHIYKMGLEKHLFLEGEAADYAPVAQKEKMVFGIVHAMADKFAVFYRKERKKKKDGFNFDRFSLPDLFDDFGPFMDVKKHGRYLQDASEALRYFCKENDLTIEKRGVAGRHFWRIIPNG